ncbi:MAG: hypothetical protein HY289_00350 [Planctomycetes bacterium]|nr:hypothetical protein [Planctomycetota bacterium]
MKKLLIIGTVGAVALIAIAAKTNAWSYVKTAFGQVSAEAKDQVPIKFELDRIRNEIAEMDSDISKMVRPIAEYRVAIIKMKKDIAKTQENVDKRKSVLLGYVEELDANPKEIDIDGRKVPAEHVRRQLQRDMEGVKNLEKFVKVQQQVLEAKEQALRASQEQLAKVVTKKDDYKIRLAQLEAEEESLKVASIGTEPKFDSSRTTHIEDSLASVELRIDVQRKMLEARNGELANVSLPERTQPNPADLEAVRAYLQGNEPPAKTASNK